MTNLDSIFSRQEYWGGLPCRPPGDLPNPGIDKPASPEAPALPADSLPMSSLSYQGSPLLCHIFCQINCCITKKY